MSKALPINQIATALNEGQCIAYPTESSFGIGCNALDKQAVATIRQLKNRDEDKAFILLIKDLTMAKHYIDTKQHALLNTCNTYWPGPFTLVFNAEKNCPQHLIHNGKVALRLSANDYCKKLCSLVNFPIITTSANLQGQPPIMTAKEVIDAFPSVLHVLDGEPEKQPPTQIIDMCTGIILRK